MKSLVDFITEANATSIDSGMVEAYFNDIHDGLKTAVENAVKFADGVVDNIADALGTDSAGLVLDKSQIYGSIIEGLLFKNLNNEVGFKYKQGVENTSDKDFICTKTAFSDNAMNKLDAKTFSIQVKTSKNGAAFTSNVSGTTEPSFFILISYKKNGYNISLDKAYFGYLTPGDWSVSSKNAKLNTNSFVKKSDKMLFEI